MNVFIALKGSHFWFLFDFTAAGVVPCGGRKTSPRTSIIVQPFLFFIYFSVLLGIQEMRPSTFEIACIYKCESHPRKLWKTTGMAVVLDSTAVWDYRRCGRPSPPPPVFPSDVTVVADRVALECLSFYFSHTCQVVALLWVRQSSRVIRIALGLASSFDSALLLLECFSEVLCCIGTSRLDWKLCLPVASLNNIAVAAGLIVLRVPGVALHWIGFGALNLGCESLKVCVDGEWGWGLFMVVLEG